MNYIIIRGGSILSPRYPDFESMHPLGQGRTGVNKKMLFGARIKIDHRFRTSVNGNRCYAVRIFLFSIPFKFAPKKS